MGLLQHCLTSPSNHTFHHLLAWIVLWKWSSWKDLVMNQSQVERQVVCFQSSLRYGALWQDIDLTKFVVELLPNKVKVWGFVTRHWLPKSPKVRTRLRFFWP
jgi:hypothetical protein